MLSRNNASNWLWYGIAILLALFSFYYQLGSYSLLNNNEGLYASIAQYMLLHKSYIIPHLNCLPYLEKPPLLYWLLTSSFAVGGFTATAARFIPASCAFLLCIALLYCNKTLRASKVNIIGTLIFASSIGVIIIARMVFFDMLLTLLVSLALLNLYNWQQTNSKANLRWAYIMLALAILTKGLVAVVLIGGTFIIFLILEKPTYQIKQLYDLPGIILFLAIVLPWHILAALQHPGFTWYYLVNEQLLRFVSQRVPHDYYTGSIYYYLPRILIYLAPWSLLFPLFFWHHRDNWNSPHKRFLWCWVLIPLVFFSLSQAKANYYMIVSMPALALLLAYKISELYAAHKEKLVSFWCSAVLEILIVGIVVASLGSQALVTTLQLKANIFYTLGYAIIAVMFCIILARYRYIALILLAGIIVPITITATQVATKLEDQISAVKVGRYLAKHHTNNSVYLYQDFEKISAIGFYSGRCFKMVDSHSNDLYYAQHLPAYQDWFLSQEAFAHNKAYKVLVINKSNLADIIPIQSQFNFHVLKNLGDWWVIAAKH